MPASSTAPPRPTGSPFAGGLRAGAASVFTLVLVGTYTSIGALAHDFGFPLAWAVLSTLLVWAAPGQVILVSSLGAGAAPAEVAIAVGLSGMRLLPMVVALLPLVRTPTTRARNLIAPAHLTAISMWIESLRLLPAVARGERIAFVNGIGVCFIGTAAAATIVGYELAQTMPTVLVAALLFVSPMSFLLSAVRNARIAADRVALLLGIVLAPSLAWRGIDLDLMWTGLAGGAAAFAAHRMRAVRP